MLFIQCENVRERYFTHFLLFCFLTANKPKYLLQVPYFGILIFVLQWVWGWGDLGCLWDAQVSSALRHRNICLYLQRTFARRLQWSLSFACKTDYNLWGFRHCLHIKFLFKKKFKIFSKTALFRFRKIKDCTTLFIVLLIILILLARKIVHLKSFTKRLENMENISTSTVLPFSPLLK